MMVDYQPGTINDLGGDSAMDDANEMWMVFEQPATSFFGDKQQFLVIGKRTYQIGMPENAKFIGIPTTSVTGAEVTPFAFIT
ncbi:iron-containing alcohol dehydrogenase, partial [Staphylococcus aureus]